MKVIIILIFCTVVGAEVIYKDKPIYNFKDSDYICTSKQLKQANKRFMKCENTPVFKDCYAESVMMYCSRKWF